MLGFLLLGCSARERSSADDPQRRTPAEAALHKYSQAVEIADLYGFSGAVLGGGTARGFDYDGGPLAVWFWTPWCPTCNSEATEVVASARKFPSTNFLGIAGKDDQSAMQKFVDQYGIDFPTLVDADGSLWHHFGVTGQPAWVFVTASGAVHRTVGAPNQSELEAVLDALSKT